MEDTKGNTADETQIDLLYRPEQYWTTPDPTFPLLEAIADAGKRKRAEQLARAFNREAIVALNEQGQLTDEEIEFYQGCGLYAFDEEYGNAAFLEEPLEIASAGFDVGDGFGGSRFSVDLSVKRCVGQTAFRLQGQGESSDSLGADDTEETSVEDPWQVLEANRPLTLGDVASMLEEALPHGNIELSLAERWDYLEEKTEDTLSSLGISASSAFYPQLWQWFDQKIEEWRQSVRESGNIEEAH